MNQAINALRIFISPYLTRANAVHLAWFALGLLCAAAGGVAPQPLGPSIVAAGWLASGQPFAALAGAAVGAILRYDMGALAVMALFAGAGLLLELWRKRLRARDKLILLACAWLAIMPFMYKLGHEKLFACIACMTISPLAAAVTARGAQNLRSFLKGRRLARSDRVILLLASALLVAALGSFEFYIRPAAILAAFLTLAAVEAFSSVGVVAAVVFSAAGMIYGSASMPDIGALAMCALAAYAVSNGGRYAMAAGFAAVWAFIAASFSLPPLYALEAAMGALGFALMPKRAHRVLETHSLLRGRSEAERSLALMRMRLSCTSDVIREVSGLFAEESPFTQRQLRSVSTVMEKLASDEPLKRPRRFEVRTGAAGCPMHANGVTGDSMGMREVDGRTLLMLSDGMGTGSVAHSESAAAIALFGDMLSVGFELDDAEECVNRLMMLRSGRDIYATLDALLIDLNSGSARFIKCGAPPSYILRDGRVHTIYAEALPIGILSEARPAVHEFNLKRGDTVVMMTDGLMEALSSELIASLLEKVGGANTADDAASELLSCALERACPDDMSAIVARII